MSFIVRPIEHILTLPVYKAIYAQDPNEKRMNTELAIHAILRVAVGAAVFFSLMMIPKCASIESSDLKKKMIIGMASAIFIVVTELVFKNFYFTFITCGYASFLLAGRALLQKNVKEFSGQVLTGIVLLYLAESEMKHQYIYAYLFPNVYSDLSKSMTSFLIPQAIRV